MIGGGLSGYSEAGLGIWFDDTPDVGSSFFFLVFRDKYTHNSSEETQLEHSGSVRVHFFLNFRHLAQLDFDLVESFKSNSYPEVSCL